MKCSGAHIIVHLLERQGIKTVVGIPGGSTLPLYDALHDSNIEHVLARHEQGAGFIAQGMARSTGKAAVCLATSGPGATNLLTAIADAKADSVPMVAITGQVPTGMIGTDAFQEVDTYGLSLPITKHNFQVRCGAELLELIPEAFRISQSGRPGPVLVDIPKDVQTEMVDFDVWPEPAKPESTTLCQEDMLARLANKLRLAKRPILYVGGGVIAANACGALHKLADKNSIPMASTLMGLGCMERTHPLYLGLLGMHGARSTNMLMEEADLLLALGVRFDDRATGNAREFCKHADIVHVDIDSSEIDKIKSTNLAIVGDVKHALDQLFNAIPVASRRAWLGRVAELRDADPIVVTDRNDAANPLQLIRHVAAIAEKDAIITTDVGQHQMWVAQSYPFAMPRTFLTSGGLGTMGFGLPAAIGAALANPERQVICFSGDGSFQMNIQELATLAEKRPNLKVIVMNNNHLGLVRQQQELFFNKRIYASKFELGPDFSAIAQGFNIPACSLENERDPWAKLERTLRTPGPGLVNAPIHWAENVYPMVPPGAANSEMIGEPCHA